MVDLYSFKIKAGENIAEIGGGRGLLAEWMQSRGVRIKVFMEPMLDKRDLKNLKDALLLKMRAGEVGAGHLLAERNIETIVMQDVIEHIRPEEMKAMLDEYMNKSNNLPRLVGRTPNLKSTFGLRNSFGDNTHILRFTDNSLRSYLAELGYTNIKIKNEPYIITGVVSLARYIPYKLILFYEWLKFLIVFGQGEGAFTPNLVFEARVAGKRGGKIENNHV